MDKNIAFCSCGEPVDLSQLMPCDDVECGECAAARITQEHFEDIVADKF